MAQNFDWYPNARMEAPRTGSFWGFARVNLSQWYRQRLETGAAQDDFKVMKTRDKWIVRDSYYRIREACSATVTLNIGTTEAGTEIAAAVDGTDTSTYADWTQGTIDPNDNVEALTADGYIWLMIDTAETTQGIVEIAVEFVAGPDDNEL
jgi:hypothetical protein